MTKAMPMCGMSDKNGKKAPKKKKGYGGRKMGMK